MLLLAWAKITEKGILGFDGDFPINPDTPILFRINKLEQLIEIDKVSMNETVYASGYQVS